MSLAKATEAPGFQPSGVSSCDRQVQYRIEVKFNAEQVVGHIIARSGQKRREVTRSQTQVSAQAAHIGRGRETRFTRPCGAQKYDSGVDLRFSVAA